MATIKHSVADSKENVTIPPKQPQKTAQNEVPKPKRNTCGKMHKTENCWNGANVANDPRMKKREFTIPTNEISKQPVPTPSSQQKN